MPPGTVTGWELARSRHTGTVTCSFGVRSVGGKVQFGQGNRRRRGVRWDRIVSGAAENGNLSREKSS